MRESITRTVLEQQKQRAIKEVENALWARATGQADETRLMKEVATNIVNIVLDVYATPEEPAKENDE